MNRKGAWPRAGVRWPSAVALSLVGVVGLGVRNQMVAPLLAIHIAGVEVFGLTLWPLHFLLACARSASPSTARLAGRSLAGWRSGWDWRWF